MRFHSDLKHEKHARAHTRIRACMPHNTRAQKALRTVNEIVGMDMRELAWLSRRLLFIYVPLKYGLYRALCVPSTPIFCIFEINNVQAVAAQFTLACSRSVPRF